MKSHNNWIYSHWHDEDNENKKKANENPIFLVETSLKGVGLYTCVCSNVDTDDDIFRYKYKKHSEIC